MVNEIWRSNDRVARAGNLAVAAVASVAVAGIALSFFLFAVAGTLAAVLIPAVLDVTAVTTALLLMRRATLRHERLCARYAGTLP